MKTYYVLVGFLLLASCTQQATPLTAEQYTYFDECEFVSEYVQVNCTEYAVRAQSTQPFEEACYFSERSCINASATVQYTDIRIQANFVEPVQEASIDFKGLVRECRVADTQVTCLLPIVQVDREYKQPFTLTVDGEQGKLLVYI